MRLGDESTGGTELAELYRQLADDEEPFDLPQLLLALGVSRNDTGVHFDNDAPDAPLRKALLAPAEEAQAAAAKPPD